ncbi:Exo endo phos 2 domain containing protein [Asbolus verrucosus]|uniref:Exo endo phos 2 domain containing protein n=1 Tax=Asbolus verrucosus TaxID=1661398 RepID=A0A482VES6_ASBVE|nr:Exo endo phos 2 domain containing protein [Asbolus verrucosus]
MSDGVTHAGGTALLIRRGIPFSEMNKLPATFFEKTAIRLSTTGILVVGIYNRPDNTITEKELRDLFNMGNKVIILGDTKAKHTRWGCNRPNPSKNYRDKHDIHLHFLENPTHYPANNSTPTTIDLLLTKNLHNFPKPMSLAKPNSDHNQVVVHIGNVQVDDVTKYITSYKNTN